MRCYTARLDLTALVDGELAPDRAAELRAHTEGCLACAADLESIERMVAMQRAAVPRALPELSLGFETRLRQRLAEVRETDARRWWRTGWWKPATIGALATAGVLLAAAPLGGPSAVLVPLGIQDPPRKVATKPQLFTEYPIIEHLDALENFDTVKTIPLEDVLKGAS